ncbi:folylpolyglutamate synthase/dihydrofolate synthase family protein [Leifsonia shinshuensis]|uniref:bifunctional folylpolyglutamate synthase/dihydrofolate synthase n=1 Tax=Leifsonia shinshuensis TaxID=150026 RepID=UPI00285D0630|nr:folylpolyglutamate synthase/dihydrofolate synthase family protein [Leifsonia shinshuensis]MDR6970362.1 dihydrofolate synthase/folylpolyglutamate synthase [Leifsonia shinshuensis]
MTDEEDFRERAEEVYQALLARVGEGAPERRLDATRRAVELLGDPQRAYPIIHVTGTNGKTSTSRIAESLLRAYGLRTGLLTSPHLVRFNERIVIDGQPIDDEALVRNWEDISPYLEIVDAELTEVGKQPLTFFEALTALAYAAFADAPVDVAVIEVGMGGEWDSTNVGDGQVAVFTPIALDHTKALGDTIEEIARTKSGIIKPSADVVSSAQTPEADRVLREASELTESTFAEQPADFGVDSTRVAVGGQLVTVRGRAATYEDVFLPLYGDHQAQNAAVAVAAVETFLGRGTQPLKTDLVEEGFATATSPGRLQLIGIEPSILVDAAHNPAGAETLADALRSYFDFDEITFVIGILGDKDARGVIRALAPVATQFFVTRPDSERAREAEDFGDLVREEVGDEATIVYSDPIDALESARDWAGEEPRRAVVVAGSIVLVGQAMAYAEEQEWKQAAS